MNSYCDAHLLAADTVGAIPPDMHGGILMGPSASELCARLRMQHPQHTWHCTGELAHLVGASDARFPGCTPPPVRLDLRLSNLHAALRGPTHAWFALAESAAQRRQLIHLDLPPGTASIAPLRKLAGTFPRARFWIDPFIHGPELASGWQAHVRAAEVENIWLSTLRLFPAATPAWSAAQAAEALHFTMGEVGASKVLFASGRVIGAVDAVNPADWLASFQVLDAEQQRLVLRGNFEELLGACS